MRTWPAFRVRLSLVYAMVEFMGTIDREQNNMDKLELHRTIDLSRYPLDKPDSPEYRSLATDKRKQLNHNQYCTMPGFLLDAQRRKIVAAVEKRQQHTHRADGQRNVYLQRSRSETLPDDHPRNIFARGSYNMMGAHLLDHDSPLKDIYYWPPMQQFIADIVGEPRLYPSDDPYQPVNVLCQGNGDCSAWHFDSHNAFTMTLMLQAPESGVIGDPVVNETVYGIKA